MIELSKIRMDGGTQSRASIHEDTVADYAEAMADDCTVFPPIVVYYDGKDYWLADGFHRVAAWAKVGRIEVPADVRQGDRRAAILHSVAANSAHGLRRSNEDKRRAVMTLLDDPEWSKWSNREIARRCAVSESFVRSLRTERSEEPRTYTTRHGTEAKMDTTNIGKAKPAERPSEPERDQPAARAVDQNTSSGTAAPQESEPAPQRADIQLGGSGAGDDQADPNAKERKALSKLTRDALEDDVIGLRAELVDFHPELTRESA